jgi:hypothetical protein
MYHPSLENQGYEVYQQHIANRADEMHQREKENHLCTMSIPSFLVNSTS